MSDGFRHVALKLHGGEMRRRAAEVTEKIKKGGNKNTGGWGGVGWGRGGCGDFQ